MDSPYAAPYPTRTNSAHGEIKNMGASAGTWSGSDVTGIRMLPRALLFVSPSTTDSDQRREICATM